MQNARSRVVRVSERDGEAGMSYGVFLIAYVSIFVVFLLFARLLGYQVVFRPEPLDVLLLSLATFRLTEVVTEEKVARCLRAPFCERITLVNEAGEEEEEEVPRGSGLRRVAGELLLCPWCTGIWIATGLTFMYVVAPDLARIPLLVFGVAAGGMIFQIFAKLMDRTRKSLPEE